MRKKSPPRRSHNHPLGYEVQYARSGFFFKVASREVQAIRFDITAKGKKIIGKQRAIRIKLQDGSTVYIGKSTDDLCALKRRVRDTYDIPIENQRYFRVEGNSHHEVKNEWDRLSDNDATFLLIPREPWQRVDLETKTIYLSLPKPCLDSFERILDFMYSYRCDESSFQKLGEVSPSFVLPALWLAGRLDIPDLEDHLISYLDYTVTSQTAHAYLLTAVELGPEQMLDTLMQLVSQSMESVPAETWNSLPLEVVEGLLEGSCVSEARGRLVVSYLQAREAEERLDEQLFQRLMRNFVAGRSVRASAGTGQGAAGDDNNDADDSFVESISAENAVALLGLARRFGDAEVQGRCLRRMARGFSGLGAEDLARLPARRLQEMLGDEELEVGSTSWRCSKHRRSQWQFVPSFV